MIDQGLYFVLQSLTVSSPTDLHGEWDAGIRPRISGCLSGGAGYPCRGAEDLCACRSAGSFCGRFRAHGAIGVQQYLLENRQVFHVTFAPERRHPAESLGTISLDALLDYDEFCFFQNLQMPIQIAVGERA